MTNKKILACGEKNKEQNRIVLTKKQTNEKTTPSNGKNTARQIFKKCEHSHMFLGFTAVFTFFFKQTKKKE